MGGRVADQATVDRLRLGDHVCWAFDDDRQRSDAMAGYVRAGLRDTHKIVYLIDNRPAGSVIGDLRARGVSVDAPLHSGQLTVSTAEETCLTGGRFDPAAMHDHWRHEFAQARREGYAGLRAVEDMSWGLRPIAGAERLRSYETQVSRVVSLGFGIALCLYDRRLFTSGQLNEFSSVHPGTMRPGAGSDWFPLLRMARTGDPFGVRLGGEADLSNREALQSLLRELLETSTRHTAPVVVDLTEVTFVDATAARALARAVAAASGRLHVTGASPGVARLLRLHDGGDPVASRHEWPGA
jgi:anti-anti-sigma factor